MLKLGRVIAMLRCYSKTKKLISGLEDDRSLFHTHTKFKTSVLD